MLLLDIYQGSTNYLLGRHATVKDVITSSYYRRSPLFQDFIEIPCLVTVTMPGTIRNHLLLERCRELVTELYYEPKDENTIGNFVSFLYQKRKRFSSKTSGFCLDARKRTARTKLKTKEQMRQL